MLASTIRCAPRSNPRCIGPVSHPICPPFLVRRVIGRSGLLPPDLGLSSTKTGTLLPLTLLDDTAVPPRITTQADRIGRRRMLVIGSGLMARAGIAFASTGSFLVLIIADTIGFISPRSNQVGPFLPIERAALLQIVSGGEDPGIRVVFTGRFRCNGG